MTEAVTNVPVHNHIKKDNRHYGKHDVLDGEYKLSQKILAELIGTAIFVYGVCSSGVFYGSNPACAILGSSCMGGIIIFIFGRVSGAHFNPAVSLALFLRNKLNCLELITYVVAQIIGGIIGVVLLALCRRGKFKELSGNQIPDYLITLNGGTSRNTWCYLSAFFLNFWYFCFNIIYSCFL